MILVSALKKLVSQANLIIRFTELKIFNWFLLFNPALIFKNDFFHRAEIPATFPIDLNYFGIS